MKCLILAVVCFTSFIFSSAATSQIIRPRRMMNVFVSGFLFWMLLYILTYLLTPANLFFLPISLASRHRFLDLVYGCVLFSFFFHGFLCAYYVLGEGFSTSFLPALREAGQRGMTAEEVVGLFRRSDGTDKIISWRLPRLVAKGYISFDPESDLYSLTPKGAVVARLAAALKRILSLGAGG